MQLTKKIDYYLENGPEKVKPITKDEMYNSIINSNGNCLDGLLYSPLCLKDSEIIIKIEELSKNLIKYYPWKIYIDIAKTRGLDISELIKNLPDYNLFKMVDENEYCSDN